MPGCQRDMFSVVLLWLKAWHLSFVLTDTQETPSLTSPLVSRVLCGALHLCLDVTWAPQSALFKCELIIVPCNEIYSLPEVHVLAGYVPMHGFSRASQSLFTSPDTSPLMPCEFYQVSYPSSAGLLSCLPCCDSNSGSHRLPVGCLQDVS